MEENKGSTEEVLEQDVQVGVEVEANAENPATEPEEVMVNPEDEVPETDGAIDYPTPTTPMENIVQELASKEEGRVEAAQGEEAPDATEEPAAEDKALGEPQEESGAPSETTPVDEVPPDGEPVKDDPQFIKEPEPDIPDTGKKNRDPKFVDTPSLTPSKKQQFDPRQSQGALKDEDQEGGVMVQRNTESQKEGDSSKEGEAIKPQPDMQKDSKEGKFEVTGFTVEYKLKDESIRSVQIRDYFNDLDTAFAGINGGSYLMPMPGGGYKVAKITGGAPIICYNERQLYIYKNEDWSKS